MKLTKEEFSQKLAKNQLAITLIGMSNIGKTFWSKKLSKHPAHNFQHINCDAILETILEPELKALGYKGLADMAKWLGHPFEQQFKTNEEKLTKLEAKLFKEILENLGPGENTTIDTPGSFIYAGEEICNNFKEKTLIVYLEATPEMKEKMFEKFFSNPKPITWGKSFDLLPNESEMEALKRCYPRLLEYRSRHYEKYADTIIPYHELKEELEAEEFLELIRKYL